MALFSQIGPVKGCKIIREPGRESHKNILRNLFFRQRPILLCGVCASSGRKCGYYRNEQAPLHGQRDEGAVTENNVVLSFSQGCIFFPKIEFFYKSLFGASSFL